MGYAEDYATMPLHIPAHHNILSSAENVLPVITDMYTLITLRVFLPHTRARIRIAVPKCVFDQLK